MSGVNKKCFSFLVGG